METLTKEQIIELLKEWQEWEYRVLMDDSVWENGLPTLTCEFMDEYNLLQQEREGILLASELTEKESEVRTAEEFIRSRIKNELTFNAFDTVQQYPICMIAEWAYEFSLQQPEKEQPSDEDIEGWLDVEFALYKYPKNRRERKVNTMQHLIRDFIKYSLKAMRDGKIPGKK